MIINKFTNRFTNIKSYTSNATTNRKLRAHGSKALALGLVMSLLSVVAVPSLASAQASQPTTKADCVNWRSYSLGFTNRGKCVAYVVSNNVGNDGYGGGNNGNNGGGIGRIVTSILDAFTRLVRVILGAFF